MIVFPNAKINLGLNIVRRRPDGYHDIETVFYPIPLCDALEVVPAQATTFCQSGIPVNLPAEKNLVMKALGGSADAAFMLRLLRDVAKLPIENARLEQLASELGADCAFFIRDVPAFATGIGNQLEPVALDLSDYYLCLVKPEVAVSTAEAYAEAKPCKPTKSLKELVQLPVREWKNAVVNDFEASVFPKYPEIAEVKARMYAKGAVYAAMSGSGSSVFGIFEAPTDLKASFSGYFVWEGRLK